MVVLDTHAAVWCAGEPQRLGRTARVRLEHEDWLGIPAIVFWEIALLVGKRRLDLGLPTREWMQAILTIPRVAALPLTPEIAVEAESWRCIPTRRTASSWRPPSVTAPRWSVKTA